MTEFEKAVDRAIEYGRRLQDRLEHEKDESCKKIKKKENSK